MLKDFHIYKNMEKNMENREKLFVKVGVILWIVFILNFSELARGIYFMVVWMVLYPHFSVLSKKMRALRQVMSHRYAELEEIDLNFCRFPSLRRYLAHTISEN